jgi:hypothetical protein
MSMKFLQREKKGTHVFQTIYYSDDESGDSSESPGEKGEDEADFVWSDSNNIRVKMDASLSVKIVDFGNACWEHKHFT